MLPKTTRLTLVVLMLALANPPATLGADSRPRNDRQQIKRMQIDSNTRKARRTIAKARQRLEEYLRTGVMPAPSGPKLPPRDLRAGESTEPDYSWLQFGLRFDGLESRGLLAAAPPNVRVNNTSGDDFNGSQNEPSIAALGQNVVAAWNDWPSIAFLGSLQGYGYSNDGGQSFVDGDVVPSPPGTQWHSDPVVTVNEKTGDFFYCGLLESSAGTDSNGVAVMRGRFSGGVLIWDPPRLVRYESTAQLFIDKPWMVADSSSGNLYLSYSVFTPTSDEVVFQRSTNSGVTWGSVIKLNLTAADGLVQGSRPVVGPNGQVYAIWKEIGTQDLDFFRIRTSLNGGLTFDGERTITSLFDNFGTGAPGFNRERGVTFPSIAVDRTLGPRRGHLYVTWNESLDWIDDPPALGTIRNESEENGPFLRANPFTIGETLSGTFGSPSDFDSYSFSAISGTSYIFWCDQCPSSLYRMRVFCTDTITRLTFTGRFDSPIDPQANGSIMVWTAPSTGTYYLSMDFVNLGGSFIGPYRIRTGMADVGSERGRDQRDVFVTSSPDGITWGTPVRVNVDPPRFDNWLPEVVVAPDGDIYTMWFDWHDTPAAQCGGMSHIYVARSDNAGTTWVTVGPISSTQSDWSRVSSNLAPNQGDYLSFFGNSQGVYACWTDGRSGSPDIFAALLPLLPNSVRVTGTADVQPRQVALRWQFQSGQTVNATVYRREEGTRTILGAAQPGGPGVLTFVDNTVNSGALYVYGLRVTVAGSDVFVGEVPVAVPPGKIQASPNPMSGYTRIRYDLLPAGEEVELSVYDIFGRRLKTLVRGFQTGGRHEAVWDQTDLDGHFMRGGVYLIQLRHGSERGTSRVVVIQ